MSQEFIFDISDVLEILPHRYPFLLLDSIVEFQENERIVGIKNVSMNEPYFTGHFPGNPVFPGVLMIEALAQTGCILAKKSSQGVEENELLVLTGASDFKFKRPVRPGEQMRMEMKVKRFRKPLFIMDGLITVGDDFVTSGVISAAIAPRA